MRDMFDGIGSIMNDGEIKNLIAKDLTGAAKLLKELIEKHLQDYYKMQGNNKVYKRTGGLENSLVIDPVSVNMDLKGDTLCTYVRFGKGALHRSGFGVWAETKGGRKYSEGYHNLAENKVMNVALAVNNGYKVKQDVWFKNLNKFGKRKGAHFVEKAIDEFNATNPYGIFINKRTDIIIT